MNPLIKQPLPTQLRILRRIIKYGSRSGSLGWVGRWVGKRVGWPLYGGARIIIDDPLEAMQALMLQYRAYEPNLAYLIAESLGPGCLFVDVGGNMGNHSLIAAATGAEVMVFEPLPRLADRIEASVALNRFARPVKIVRMAVGAEKSSAILHVAKRSDDGSHSLIPGVDAESMEHVNVSVAPLDELLHGVSVTPTLVKVDVEGYEARVLDGASSLLASKERPIWLVETADRLADKIGESAASVTERLLRSGYSLWRVPDIGPVDPVGGKIGGELANYCAVHPSSPIRHKVESLLANLALG